MTDITVTSRSTGRMQKHQQQTILDRSVLVWVFFSELQSKTLIIVNAKMASNRPSEQSETCLCYVMLICSRTINTQFKIVLAGVASLVNTSLCSFAAAAPHAVLSF